MPPLKAILKSCRQVRHGVRLHLDLLLNRLILSRLRRRNGHRPLVGILLLENLGDIVACEPVARHIRAETPDAVIVWGVRQMYRELVDNHPDVDVVLSLHCLSERLLLANAGLFDRVVDLHVSGRSCSLCRVPLERSPPSPVRLDNYFSFGGLLSSFARAAALSPLDDRPRVHIPIPIAGRIDRLGLPHRFVAVNCTSNVAAKDWPPEKWRALTARLAGEVSIAVVEVGLHPCLATDPNVINLCGRLSILESAEVVRRAALFIGVDSGPAHLANAAGTPGVILMGDYLGFTSYNPFTGPYRSGEGADIIRATGPATSIPVDAVLAAARRRLQTVGVSP